MNKHIIFVVSLIIALFIIVAGCRGGKQSDQKTLSGTSGFVIKDVGFKTPESVIHDTANDIYLVSNINGDPLAEDDNGFISQINPDGKVINLKWIDGSSKGIALNAPKGLAITDDKLFVADITTVRVFDRISGNPVKDITIPGATFLNGLAAGKNSSIFVTDSGLPEANDAVYKITADFQVELIAKNAELNRPNGIIQCKEGKLLVVSFGGNELYKLDYEGVRDILFLSPTSGLDGLVELNDGRLAFSSWEGSAVYTYDKIGEIATLIDNVKSPAGIGYDSRRNLILIPLFYNNSIVVKSAEA